MPSGSSRISSVARSRPSSTTAAASTLALLLLLGAAVPAAGAGGSNACMKRPLRFGLTDADVERYGWVCCDNEHYAERRGWYQSRYDVGAPEDGQVTFYDPACGVPLFVAPHGRTSDAFRQESRAHGWPSFRDGEVVTEHVKRRSGGEIVSSCGTHLGHDLPDSKGARYCINLICIAGHPQGEWANESRSGSSSPDPVGSGDSRDNSSPDPDTTTLGLGGASDGTSGTTLQRTGAFPLLLAMSLGAMMI